MEIRNMEKLNKKVSLLGFGCMRFPTLENGQIDEVNATEMIDYAIKHGVNYIDTAYPYHNGESELFVGKVLKRYDRSSFTIATKLPVWKIKSEEDVLNIFEEQLKRLQVNHIDFYLLHALDKESFETVERFHIIDICKQLKAEGKIKYFGFSFHDTYDVFENIMNAYDWDFVQLQLNYMDMDIQAGQRGVDLANKKRIPIIVMEPIKGGTLATLPKECEQLLKGEHKDWTIASWALRFVANIPGVKVILSGMSSFDHVKDNIKTCQDGNQLTNNDKALLNQVTQVLKDKSRNNCTGCEYCMAINCGVNIAKNFKIWNNMFMFNQPNMKNKYKELKDHDASHCIGCKRCESLCPQKIIIHEDLKRLRKDMGEVC